MQGPTWARLHRKFCWTGNGRRIRPYDAAVADHLFAPDPPRLTVPAVAARPLPNASSSALHRVCASASVSRRSDACSSVIGWVGIWSIYETGRQTYALSGSLRCGSGPRDRQAGLVPGL